MRPLGVLGLLAVTNSNGARNRESARADNGRMQTREPDARTDALATSVIGAAIEVHRTLGPGYLEHVYQEAMCVELELRGLPFERQSKIAVRYKGRPIGESRLDLLVAGHLIVELEAVTSIAPIHRAQVLSYLKATDRSLALLINFNVPVLRDGLHRVVLTARPSS